MEVAGSEIRTVPRRRSERSARVEWLKQNKTLWSEVDPGNFKGSEPLLRTIAERLHAEGFYSPKTLIGDIQMGVFKMIKKIRNY